MTDAEWRDGVQAFHDETAGVFALCQFRADDGLRLIMAACLGYGKAKCARRLRKRYQESPWTATGALFDLPRARVPRPGSHLRGGHAESGTSFAQRHKLGNPSGVRRSA
jgi:hypothetical protein